jgi:hypothetical protein
MDKVTKTSEDMTVTVWRDSDPETLTAIMQFVWGLEKKPNTKKIYASDDSIAEAEHYVALCEVPRSVAMQLVTHRKKMGNYSWMSSGRPDLAYSLKTEYSRTQKVRIAMTFTPRGIIDMAHYRLCTKAELPTRKFMALLRDIMEEIDPNIARLMMPMCAYRNGLCTMIHGCGRPQKYDDWTNIVDSNADRA